MKVWGFGILAAALLAGGAGSVDAAELRAEFHKATRTGPGEAIGTVTISDGSSGAVIKPDLKGLPPGPHGFHVHEYGTCQPITRNTEALPAGGAGGHLDPENAFKHAGPQGEGHAGDLPVLQVAQDGTATGQLTAPRIKDIAQIRGKAVVIHAGADNYSDEPAPLGGGGARIACGVLR